MKKTKTKQSFKQKTLTTEKSKIKIKDNYSNRWYPHIQKPPPNAGMAKIPEGDENCLCGLKFVITGVLDSLEREEAANLIKKLGGKVTSAVSGVTSFLLAGEEPGKSKLAKAREKSIPLIDEKGLFDLIVKRSPQSTLKKTLNKENFTSINHNINIMKQKGLTKLSKQLKNSAIPLTDKYSPSTISDLVGNKKEIAILKKFLINYDPYNKDKKNKKAVLISGSPGIGKTSSIYAIAKDLKFDLIEMNASDFRSKKILDSKLKGSLSSLSLSTYFTTIKSPKKIILMEEVDGMTTGDTGGISQLITFIKSTKYPIVCTCNDRSNLKLKTLTNYTLEIRYRKPTLNEIKKRIEQITVNEKIDLSSTEISHIINISDFDIRSILNTINFYKKIGLEKKEKNKDEMPNSWEAANKLFDIRDKTKYFKSRIRFYFVDQMFVPLLIQENYLQNNYNVKSFEPYFQASQFIADSDIINNSMYSNQNFELMPLCGIFSCIAPATVICKNVIQSRIAFPMWLGKNSNMSKNKKLLNQVESKINFNFKSTSSIRFKNEKVHFVASNILFLLIEKQKYDVNKVVEKMIEYNISKEDYDFINDLATYETNTTEIPSRIKSSITRKYNSLFKKYDYESFKKVVKKNIKIKPNRTIKKTLRKVDSSKKVIKKKRIKK